MTSRQLASLLDKVADSFGNPQTIVDSAALAGISTNDLFDFMVDSGFAELTSSDQMHKQLMLSYAKTFFCLGAMAERRRQ